MIAKLAREADLWYNNYINIVVPGRCCKHPQAWINLYWRSIMDTLPPHAQDGNSPSQIPAASGVYMITCILNKRIYVGSATDLRHRHRVHFRTLRQNKHHNLYLQRAWNKYGEEAFTFEILELVLVPEMLTAREQYWFDKLKPFGRRGFNMTPNAGSSLGTKRTPESIEKVRLVHLGRKASPETRERMRQSHLGMKRTPESIEKSRQGHIGKKHSPEAIEKIRQASLGNTHSVGRKHSPETIEKIRQIKSTPEAIEKNRQFHFGRKRPPETIEKLSKTFIITSPDGTEYVVHGITQFCREHHLDASSLVKVAKGKREQYKGWKARYSSEGGEQWAL